MGEREIDTIKKSVAVGDRQTDKNKTKNSINVTTPWTVLLNQVETKNRWTRWSQMMQTSLWNLLPKKKNISKCKVIRKYLSLTCFTVIWRLLITLAVTCLLNIIYCRVQGSQKKKKIIRCLFFLWIQTTRIICLILLRNSNGNEQLILPLLPARNLTGRIKDGYFKPNEEYNER